MKRISLLWLALAFFATADFASAQIDPVDQYECVAELETDGLLGTHCHLLKVEPGSAMTTSSGDCDLERNCSISAGTIILTYTGPSDPNIDVISNEGIIPVKNGSTYTFNPTEVEELACGQSSQFTFSLIYYVSGAPHVICEWRFDFYCRRCENEV